MKFKFKKEIKILGINIFLASIILYTLERFNIIKVDNIINTDALILFGLTAVFISLLIGLHEKKSNFFMWNIKLIFIVSLIINSYNLLINEIFSKSILITILVYSGIILILYNKDRITKKSKEEDKHKYSKIVKAILITLIISLYLFNLLAIKFIDTDEGRLFYDANLITQGKTPFKDFEARAPLVIYSLSIYISLLGNSITPLYVLSILLAIISSFLVYLLSKRLFNEKIALISTLIFSTAPILIMLLHVKTQSFEVPLVLSSLLLFDTYLTKKNKFTIVFSLFLFILALFCRESAIFFAPSFLGLILWRIDSKKEIIKHIKKLLLYLLITVIIFLVFSSVIFYNSEKKIIESSIKVSWDIDSLSKSRLSLIPDYFSDFYLILYLISISIIFLSFYLYKGDKKIRYNLILPHLTIFSLACFYTYNAFRQGFWPQYLMEFAPFYSIAIGLTISYITKIPKKRIFKIVTIFMILSLLAVSNLESYKFIKEYKGIYHKEGSQEVAQYIKENTYKNETIFGGNPIYSFLSGRRHFMDLSHGYYDEESISKVVSNIEKSPPKIIIVDYYLKDSYLKDKRFKEFINKNYIKEMSLSKTNYKKTWEADIYKLKY